jgi:hypothetical protein
VNEVELGAKAFWLVLVAGVVSGVISWWVFRHWSNTAKLHVAGNRILAHLLELRLFAAEPALVMRAQRDLIAANFEFLRFATIPSLLLVIPFAVFLIAMNAIFGHVPLRIGQPAIVTLEYRASPRTALPQAQLVAPDGILVETPPVRIPAASQISWRIRPVRTISGDLRITFNGLSMSKSISSNPGLQWLSDARAGSLALFLVHPLESPFSHSMLKTVSVGYPPATIIRLNWLVWFSIASVAAFLASALFPRRHTRILKTLARQS